MILSFASSKLRGLPHLRPPIIPSVRQNIAPQNAVAVVQAVRQLSLLFRKNKQRTKGNSNRRSPNRNKKTQKNTPHHHIRKHHGEHGTETVLSYLVTYPFSPPLLREIATRSPSYPPGQVRAYPTSQACLHAPPLPFSHPTSLPSHL